MWAKLQFLRYKVTSLVTFVVSSNFFVTFEITVTSNCSGTVTLKIRLLITNNSLDSFRKRSYFVPFLLTAKIDPFFNTSFVQFLRNCYNITTGAIL